MMRGILRVSVCFCLTYTSRRKQEFSFTFRCFIYVQEREESSQRTEAVRPKADRQVEFVHRFGQGERRGR